MVGRAADIVRTVGVATAPPSDVRVAANTTSGGRGAADIGSIGFEVRTTDASDARAHIIATSRHSVTRDAVGVGLEDLVRTTINIGTGESITAAIASPAGAASQLCIPKRGHGVEPVCSTTCASVIISLGIIALAEFLIAASTPSCGVGAPDGSSIGLEVTTGGTNNARAHIIATSRRSVTHDDVGVGLEDLVSTTRKINAVGVATAPPSDVRVAAKTASGGRGAADTGSIGFEM